MLGGIFGDVAITKSDVDLSNDSPVIKGRFAPSPTGRMHAGNIFAALLTWLIVKSQHGSIVLRIEDLDAQRSKPEFIDHIQRDFEMLGLTWDEGPYFQHNREEAYRAAYELLWEKALLYPCFCTRADLHAASAPHRGDKAVYPGTCRDLSEDERRRKCESRSPAVRLIVPDDCLSLIDDIQGFYSQNLASECGDFLVRRSDGTFAYQLAVVVDDADQGITSVVRGTDLLSSTPQQMYLQDLLGYSHPHYAHVPLIVAQDGRRLAKRNRDAALDALLARFGTPAGVIGHIAGLCGLTPSCEPVTPEELLQSFDLSLFRKNLPDTSQILWR